jgi:hypothetical protein
LWLEYIDTHPDLSSEDIPLIQHGGTGKELQWPAGLLGEITTAELHKMNSVTVKASTIINDTRQGKDLWIAKYKVAWPNRFNPAYEFFAKLAETTSNGGIHEKWFQQTSAATGKLDSAAVAVAAVSGQSIQKASAVKPAAHDEKTPPKIVQEAATATPTPKAAEQGAQTVSGAKSKSEGDTKPQVGSNTAVAAASTAGVQKLLLSQRLPLTQRRQQSVTVLILLLW